ncbi:MAG TPA: hypothetical protein VF650_03490 [Allosphingosinicella sp.]
MSCEIQAIEDITGLFDIAISFASDSEPIAESLMNFVGYYDLTCYNYRNFLLQQSGLEIDKVMEFIYRGTGVVVVLNSPAYGGSRSTQLEMRTLRDSAPGKTLFLIDLGGEPLEFPAHQVYRYQSLGSDVVMTIVGLARDLRRGGR